MEALFWLSQIERDNGLIWSKRLQLDTAISHFQVWKMCIEGALIRNNVQSQAAKGLSMLNGIPVKLKRLIITLMTKTYILDNDHNVDSYQSLDSFG